MVTWNPSDKDGSIVLSNGNLTATAVGGSGIVRANVSKVSGKWYWEYYIEVGGASIRSGACTSTESYPLLVVASGWSYGDNGLKYNSGSSETFGDSYTTGRTIGVAVDVNAGKIWMSLDGVSQDNGLREQGVNDAFNNVSGVIFPACSLTDGLSITARFSEIDQIYVPPYGFISVGSTEDYSFSALKLNFAGMQDPLYRMNATTDVVVSTPFDIFTSINTWVPFGVSTNFTLNCHFGSHLNIVVHTTQEMNRHFSINCVTSEDLDTVFGVIIEIPEILTINVFTSLIVSIPESLVPTSPVSRVIQPTQSTGGIPSNPIIINHPDRTFEYVDYAIYFNDSLITSKVMDGLKIAVGPDVFDTIEFSIKDSELAELLSDYDQEFSNHRVYVIIGEDLYAFLLEDRQKEEHGKIRILGRSLASLYDAPHAVELTVSVSEPATVLSIVNSIFPVGVVDWTIPDSVLFENTSYYGTPIKILQDLASPTKAVVRNTKDGRLVVKHPFPKSPTHIDKYVAKTDFNGDNLFKIGEQATRSDGYQSVRVIGYQKEDVTPLIFEVDGDDILFNAANPVIGSDVRVAVFMPDMVPTETELEISGGPNRILYHGNRYYWVKEIVDVKSGMGTTSLPIQHLMVFQPISGTSGLAYATPYSMNFIVEESDYNGSGTIIYLAEGFEYFISPNPNTESTIVTAAHVPQPVVDIRVIRTGGKKGSEAETIIDNQITDRSAAITRAIAFFVENGYNQYEVPVRFPYTEDLNDCDLISINEDSIGIHGNYMIKSLTITLNGPQYIMEGNVIRWT